ncbi:CheA signal transduction histidine kinase [Paracidovorax avenae ATCC 19860]|uniref:Chemotaxis protein CheA n=1 Tax=Paracidovorax avenae (strain ATCC 19860 / DSM 7227 / CCUG 15838 / JCM 20985 / LMG 2117 / NCPPB 1011) TaxID=643561 RepID=F0Q9H0_PARA1|nr:Hpt domain-containing protein [Paracidovorax avenae]ADX44777.1 CheA signal transduction histidine kinase [Paracidovorax avenae ATCC 19860]
MSPIDAANAPAADWSQGEQDLGPLAWVLDELRKSLDGAVKAMRRFVRDAEAARGSDLASLDAGALRIARQQLHQASGALEMVGMGPPALVLRSMEAAVQKFVQRPELCSQDAAAVIERASFALVEYLESVLAGKQVSPVALFPQYRDAQALTGAERVHPADLWPVERRFREPDFVVDAAPLEYGAEARSRLDAAVLRIVRSGDLAAAREMQDICLGFVAGQSDRQARAFWKICAGFFEALAQGRITPDVYVKRVASRVLMQYATLARGEPTVADRLVQDLLFFCAQARPAPDNAAAQPAGQSVLQAVRQAFSLDRFRPVDYSTPRFGLYDPALLAQARKRIAAATETWSALAGGDRNKLKPAADQFSLVCDSLAKLQPGSEPLSRALSRAVDSTVRSGEPPLPALAMEVATAVLYLQASFEELETAQDHMADRARRLAERLDSVAAGGESAPLEPWMEELYRRVSDHQTMGSVVDELRATLGEVEKSLDQYFRSPGDLPVLGSVPGRLAQMRGVLSVLGLDQASLAVVHMRDTVERLLRGDVPEEERQAVFEKLGSNLGALGFLIDMLSYQRTMARKLFIYDEDAGELRILMGRTRTRAGDLPEEQGAHIEARAPLPAPLPQIPDRVQPPIEDELDAAAAPLPVPADAPMAAAPAAPADAPHAAPVAPAPSAVAPTVPAASEDDADDEAELLDIFLEEAREVVANGLEAVEALRAAPADLSAQTTLRRAFHTLKGSSRMVGLDEFGEAAWSMEQVLNAWLAEQKPIQPPMLQLSDEALRAFGRWADDIAAGQAGGWEPRGFAESAQAMRERGEYLPLAGAAAVAAGVAAEVVSADAAAEEAPHSAIPAADPEVIDEHPAPDAPVFHLSMDIEEQDAAVHAAAEPGTPGAATDDVPAFDLDLDLDFPSEATAAHEVPLEAPLDFAETLPPVPDAAAEALPEEAPAEVPSADLAEDIDFSAFSEALAEGAAGQPVEAALPAGHDDAPLPAIPDAASPDAALQAAGMPPLADLLAEAERLPDDGMPSGGVPVPLELPADAWPDLSLEGEPAAAPGDAVGDDGAAAEEVALPAAGVADDAPDAGLAALEEPAPDAAEVPVEPEPVLADAATLPEAGPAVEDEAEAEEALAAVPEPEDVPSAEAGLEQALGAESPEEAVKVIETLRIGIPLYNVYLNEADEWSRRLVTCLQEWSLELHEPLPDTAVALAHSLAGSSATVGFQALSDMARALEHALQHVQLQPQGTPEQARVFMAASEDIRRLLHQFAAGFLKEPHPQILAELREILESEIVPAPWEVPAGEAPDAPPAIQVAADDDAAAEAAPAPEAEPEAPVSRGHVAPALSVPLPAQDPVPGAVRALEPPTTDIDDDIDALDVIDPDLFPIFEEEAIELLPALGAALRQWAARPENLGARNEALRALHTLKGSSRLAGAMRLGEMAHRLESAVEQVDSEAPSAEAIEPLLVSFDGLQASFDALRSIGAQGLAQPVAVEPLASEDPAAASAAGTVAESAPAPAPRRAVALPGASQLTAARPVSSQSVRVRAQLLDRLVNQAGEVMIARSRLDARMAQMKDSLADLTGNLERLRQQLRDIEVQAETQMQSRLALSKDSSADFDPLEFDRFTRVQELTRMMAESVNDVATVQRNLQRTMEGAEDDLIAQGRQARELQRDLLRTRMVEFEGISERLYAVVRQASKETGKQIKLDIAGGSIEMDRGVLDRMTPAFEHLLRNCVAHGIEAPEARTAAGKPATGSITVALKQDGNDVSVEFRDDGAGLDLERIRAKAASQGLIAPDAVVGPAEAAQLIFMPGFSTAAEVTGLSGRGIGMDVVRSEVNALGGRVETTTEAGQGTSFRMVLPLTTAVTQVVMLRAGALTLGVPANLVEIVRRTGAGELDEAYRTGSFEDGVEALPFFWAGALLQSSASSQETSGRTRPVVILRSASQRIAMHVDEVLGNQEVVVKNLGPQLSRLPGLAGMSVLASGAVVLIYNPVALATVYGEQVRGQMAAPVAASLEAGSMPAAAAGAAGGGGALIAPVSQVPLVLVVDDSITVRRVTQRLLKREGYRVALAADGLQALERLQEERPAVVLSDIEMPRMDGFDLARNIRADRELHELPIIMITSRIAQKHREHAAELGVNHYLGKPYSDEELLSLVHHYARAAAAAAAGQGGEDAVPAEATAG